MGGYVALLLQPYSVVRRLGIGVEPLHHSGRNRISSDSPFPTAPRGARPRFSSRGAKRPARDLKLLQNLLKRPKNGVG